MPGFLVSWRWGQDAESHWNGDALGFFPSCFPFLFSSACSIRKKTKREREREREKERNTHGIPSRSFSCRRSGELLRKYRPDSFVSRASSFPPPRRSRAHGQGIHDGL